MHFQREHADIMHDRHACADDRPARLDAPGARCGSGDVEAGRRRRDRDDERQDRQRRVIADHYARLVAKHGDEVSRPERGGAHQAGQREPQILQNILTAPHAAEQLQGENGTGHANQGCDYGEEKIVIDDDTGKDV